MQSTNRRLLELHQKRPGIAWAQGPHPAIVATLSLQIVMKNDSKITHLKNEAIVVCFLTLYTRVEAWATAK